MLPSAITEEDFIKARNLGYGCLVACKELMTASTDIGSHIYAPPDFECAGVTILPADEKFSRITRATEYLCNVLDKTDAYVSSNPLERYMTDWKDSNRPVQFNKIKHWLLQNSVVQIWKGCNTAHEQAFLLAYDAWCQMENQVCIFTFSKRGAYERGPGFKIELELIEENNDIIRSQHISKHDIDYAAFKAHIDKESANALAAWKADIYNQFERTDVDNNSSSKQAKAPLKSSARNNAKRKRGGQRKYDPENDKKLASEWKIAKENGKSKSDFVKTIGYTEKTFNRLLNRVGKAKKKVKL